VRTFVGRLLAEGEIQGNYRLVLNALRDLLRCTSRRPLIRTARVNGLDLARALPLPALSSSTEPKIAKFIIHQLPKWQALQAGPV
jgi:hypothetical protein